MVRENENPLVNYVLYLTKKLAVKVETVLSLTEALVVIDILELMFQDFPNEPIPNDEVGICCLYQDVKNASKSKYNKLQQIATAFLRKLETTYPEYAARGFVIDDL